MNQILTDNLNKCLTSSNFEFKVASIAKNNNL